MVNSRVLEKLRAGSFVRTVGMSRVRDPWFAETIGRLGFDVIWLDMEHRSFGNDIIDPIALACRATGIDPTGEHHDQHRVDERWQWFMEDERLAHASASKHSEARAAAPSIWATKGTSSAGSRDPSAPPR